MKLISKTSLRVVTLALLGKGVCLLGGPITPDPADCYFTPVPSTISLGFPSTTASLVALSGDGKTALLSTRYQSDFMATVIIIQDEFFVRDGLRTLLTHFETSYYAGGGPATSNGPRWDSVDLPFDGSFVATTSLSNGVSQARLLVLPGATGPGLALPQALKVSGDGAWVIGVDDSGQLVRLRRQDGHTEVLVKKGDGFASSVMGVSYTGDTVYGMLSGNDNFAVFRWTATGGFSKPTFPESFSPTSMDASGEILVGRLLQPDHTFPAYWSLRGGVVKLATMLNGVDSGYGAASLISGDGQLIFGSLGVPVVWTRHGSVYPLSTLIRGVDLKGDTFTSVDIVSHDGRAIGGSFENLTDFSQGFYLAGLALPGEGPRATIRPAAAGGRTLNFHAKTGFHYQVQSSTSLGGWSAAAIPEITGDDADHAVPLPAGSEGTTFFRVVVNP